MRKKKRRITDEERWVQVPLLRRRRVRCKHDKRSSSETLVINAFTTLYLFVTVMTAPMYDCRTCVYTVVISIAHPLAGGALPKSTESFEKESVKPRANGRGRVDE